jgi:peptidoglycan/LPS O-acetylase OafA/YrhL
VAARTTPATRSTGSSLGYLPGLDGLRAISVLAVLAFHHYAIGGHEPGFAPGGFLGVEVFFVVSGYLITSLLLAERRETGRVSLQRFWMRRARRLLPALFALLGVVILYALLFLPDSINTLKSNTLAALSYTSNWWLIISHQSYASEAGRPGLLKHLWSLAIEEQFYLLWPPLLVLGLRKLGRKRMLTTMLTVAVASTALMAVLVSGSINSAYYGTETRLSGLLLGSMMAFFFAPYQIRGRPGRGVRVALDATGALGMVVLLLSFRHFTFPSLATSDTSVFRGGFLLVDLATLLVIAAVVHPRSDAGPILGWAPLRWIGVRSYSLYLWHYPIFCVTRPGLDVPLHGWPLLVVRLGLSIGAAELSYRYVETPIRGGAIGRYMTRLRHSHGETKRRVARRGFVVAAASTVTVFALGVGLASAQGQTPTIPGFNAKAHKGDRGNRADASVLARLRNLTTTTKSTTTTARPGATTTTVKGGKHPVTSTTVNLLAHEVLAVGDSVMLGAEQSLEAAVPSMYVDAKVSRQFWDATVVLQQYKNAGLLPPTIVVHMGTNGAFSDDQFAAMMGVIGTRQVFFVNAREPRVWEAQVNATLKADVAKYPNAHLLNWHKYGGPHSDWFVGDGIHLTGVGAQNYAAFILAHLTAGR